MRDVVAGVASAASAVVPGNSTRAAATEMGTSTRTPAAGHVVGRVGSGGTASAAGVGGASGASGGGGGGGFTDASMQMKLQRAREAMAKRQSGAEGGVACGTVPVDHHVEGGGERV